MGAYCANPKRFNKLISKQRFRVEQSFGTMKRLFWLHRARYFGLAKTHAQMVMAAISLNLLKATNKITLNKQHPQSHNANRQHKSVRLNRSGLENTSVQIMKPQKRHYADVFLSIYIKSFWHQIFQNAFDKTVLATALASAQQTGMSDVATYLLEFMSKRMADNLRKEITELGKVKASEGETAMKEIMIEIRRLIDAGEVEIIIPSDEDETETFET